MNWPTEIGFSINILYILCLKRKFLSSMLDSSLFWKMIQCIIFSTLNSIKWLCDTASIIFHKFVGNMILSKDEISVYLVPAEVVMSQGGVRNTIILSQISLLVFTHDWNCFLRSVISREIYFFFKQQQRAGHRYKYRYSFKLQHVLFTNTKG